MMGKAARLDWRRIGRYRVRAGGKNRNAFLGISHRTPREEISVVALLAFSVQESELRAQAP